MQIPAGWCDRRNGHKANDVKYMNDVSRLNRLIVRVEKSELQQPISTVKANQH